VQKSISSRASKQASILHTPPNSPSHPPFLEALHSPTNRGTHHFFYFFPFLLIPISPAPLPASASAPVSPAANPPTTAASATPHRAIPTYPLSSSFLAPPTHGRTFPPPPPTFSPFPPPSPPTLFPPPSSHSPCSAPYPTPRFGPSTGISGVAKVVGCPTPASKAAGMRRSGGS
jgi:hypothetical protein